MRTQCKTKVKIIWPPHVNPKELTTLNPSLSHQLVTIKFQHKEQLYKEENGMIITAEHRPQGNIGAWSESD